MVMIVVVVHDDLTTIVVDVMAMVVAEVSGCGGASDNDDFPVLSGSTRYLPEYPPVLQCLYP